MNTVTEFEFFATCLPGVERVLADELKMLKAKRVRPLGGGVAFFGDLRTAYTACMWSRLASRVLLVVGRVSALSAEALYDGAVALPWADVIRQGASIAVSVKGANDQLRVTKFTALKVKDAVCDALREIRGMRPNVDAAHPDALIEVRVNDKRATVSLDLSGASLYARSYLFDDDSADAALACSQAAALLARMRWRSCDFGKTVLVDPACGNGELLAEAACVAADKAPGLGRSSWGFCGWALHDADAWAEVLAEANARFEEGMRRLGGGAMSDRLSSDDFARVRLVGYSESSPCVARARRRLRKAGLASVVSVVASMDALPPLCKASGAAPASDWRCFVASVLPGAVDQADARRQTEASRFVSTCSGLAARYAGADRGREDEADGRTSPDCLFGIVPAQAVADRFGIAPLHEGTYGKGRVEAGYAVYGEAPAALHTITVPSSDGGAERKVEVYEAASEQFAARLRKAYKERKKWARREGVSCYRVYDADLPDYACAIDVYEGDMQAEGNRYVHVAEYAAPSSIDEAKANRRFADALTLVPLIMDVRADHVFSKVRKRAKGGSQYRDAGRKNYVTCVGESGFLFEVDLAGYLDTGLFLDHRLTRELVGSMAKDARFLNLFAYTGSATVHAAGGGACETTTVDLSQTYLDWAERNMKLNGYDGQGHVYERADVMPWITEARRSGRRFDLIFVDPPTFSNSKAMGKRTWDVQRDHVELLIGVSRLLSEEGVAVFSCNLRSFKPDYEKLEKYGVELEDITAQTIPEDFKRNPRIHMCYLVRRKPR